MPFRSCKFSIVYTPTILKKSAARHWKRRNLPLSMGILVISIALTIIFISVHNYWFALIIPIVCMLILWQLLASYRQMKKRLTATFSIQTTIKIDMTPLNEHLSLFSKSGENKIAWDSIKEVWRYPDTWIVFTGRDRYITLPLANIPSDAQDFILEKIQNAGGVLR